MGDNPINNFPIISPLLASVESIPSLIIPDLGTTATEYPIWHNSVQEQTSLDKLNSLQIGISKVSFPQITLFESSTSQVSSTQISPCQTDFNQLGVSENSFSQIGINKIGTPQFSSTQVGISKVSHPEVSIRQSDSAQISLIPIDFFKTASIEQGIHQIYTSQISEAQISSSQINPNKFSFPSSISIQQLISIEPYSSIHDNFPTSIYDINNTALTLWNTYLQTTTPLNLNIEIKDLPTGQLAEAQITQFSKNGTPTGGTLYLDTDANGLGWYIDPTPWDNSEYSQTLTDTAYRATPDSLAYGHYDLLTTLLHETADLQGFISGYSNYDTHTQTQNGSKVFTGAEAIAILTPDGSHLSSRSIPTT